MRPATGLKTQLPIWSRILHAKYGESDPSVDQAWHDEIHRRISDIERGSVEGIPLEETLAKARKIINQ
jgi:putative addiction module component (TIGR02574 family)